MKTYEDQLAKVNLFIDNNPTHAHQRRALARGNERLAGFDAPDKFIGETVNSAGSDFLKSIHQDIFDKLPKYEKERRIEESNESQPEVVFVSARAMKPELTKDYVIAIGRDDLANW